MLVCTAEPAFPPREFPLPPPLCSLVCSGFERISTLFGVACISRPYPSPPPRTVTVVPGLDPPLTTLRGRSLRFLSFIRNNAAIRKIVNGRLAHSQVTSCKNTIPSQSFICSSVPVSWHLHGKISPGDPAPVLADVAKMIRSAHDNEESAAMNHGTTLNQFPIEHEFVLAQLPQHEHFICPRAERLATSASNTARTKNSTGIVSKFENRMRKSLANTHEARVSSPPSKNVIMSLHAYASNVTVTTNICSSV